MKLGLTTVIAILAIVTGCGQITGGLTRNLPGFLSPIVPPQSHLGPGTTMGFVSAGVQNGTGSGGWKIMGSVGSPTTGTLRTLSGGWKVYGTVQGSLTSQ